MSTKILLIEDNPGDSRLIKELLNIAFPEKYHIKTELSLNDGLKTLVEEKFDVVLTDLNLPDSDGAQTYMRLQKQNFSIPIVVLSGLKELALQVVKMGAQAYLIKGQGNGYLISRTIDFAIESKQFELLAQSNAIAKVSGSYY